MTSEELNNKVQELKKELFELRFKQSVSKLSNPLSINECKKDIARAIDPFVLFFKHRLSPTIKDSEEFKCLFMEKNIGTEIIEEKIK